MIELLAVSHFGSSDVPRLLASLQSQSDVDWRLTLVDNSQDATEAAALQSILVDEPRARLLTPPANAGYFGGAQLALAEINAVEADAVIVSNVDIHLPDRDTLQKIRVASSRPGIGVLAPAIRSQRNGQDQNPHMLVRPSSRQQLKRKLAMSTPALAQVAIFVSYVKRQFRRNGRSAIVSEGPVYAAHGSFMVFLREYFVRGGDFSHPVFLFGEELTVAEKARNMGLVTIYLPSVSVEHVEHGQMGYLRSRRVLEAMGEATKYCYELIASNRSTSSRR